MLLLTKPLEQHAGVLDEAARMRLQLHMLTYADVC
jgi:hypothetical protein